MVTEEKSDNLNDEKDDQQNSTIPTAVDHPIFEDQRGTGLFTHDSGDSLLSQSSSDDEDDLCAPPLVSRDENSTIPPQPSSLGFANESVNTLISIDNNREKQTSNKPAEYVEQVANENTQPKSVANKQASNSNKSHIKENSVKWPTVATWVFAATEVLTLAAALAAYFALGTSLLVAGVAAGIGAFCIVAAIAIHYCNKAPSDSLKEPDAEAIAHNVTVEAN